MDRSAGGWAVGRRALRVWQGLLVWGWALLGWLVGAGQAHALSPPSEAEWAQLQASGTLGVQAEQARAVGNHLLDPASANLLSYRLARAAGTVSADTPPPGWRGGLPASGSPKVLVLLIDFPDQPHAPTNTQEWIAEAMFGAGGPTKSGYPYESLRAYYQRSSYGQLNLQGHVTPWWRARYARSYYQGLGGNGIAALIDEALTGLQASGHPIAQYDNDGDGTIDTLFVKWAGPAGAWASFWWAKMTAAGSARTYDGKRVGRVVWSWAGGNHNRTTLYDPRVDIHETGHALGLPDYYDYNAAVGPKGGAGGYDMMDSNLGDHNAFSKFVLGWLTPQVVASGSVPLTLRPLGSHPDAVLFMPGAAAGQPFGEYFLAEYRQRAAGNDTHWPGDGLALWHVDARLDAAGSGYRFDNSYTAHKLLARVEADGLNQISQGRSADAGDFYTASTQFGPATNPNSRRYDGLPTGASMTGISAVGETMSATFAVAEPVALRVTRTGGGTGTVVGSPVGLDCGSVCSATMAPGTRVLLTAQPAAGSLFAGWSGACTGTGPTCVLSPRQAAAVTARFELPTYVLAVARSGRGTGTVQGNGGLDCGRACVTRYTVGTPVTLRATPSAQSLFTGWSGACTGTAPTCTVTLDAARAVRAEFQPQVHVVTVRQAGSAGRVTGLPTGVSCLSGCSFQREAGSVLTLAAKPGPGQRFGSWSGACTGGGVCRLNVDGAKSVTATFIGP